MCARRFLMVVFFLTLLVVAAGFAIFQFGDKVLIRSATPSGHFTAPPVDSGPDYAADASWLARPTLADDPSRWLPRGLAASEGPAATSATGSSSSKTMI